MQARKFKLWSWTDYQYPMWVAIAFISLCALVGMFGLYQSGSASRSQVVALSSESTCRAGIASKVDIALLDAFDFVLSAPTRGTPEEQAQRARLLADIRDARAERASTGRLCNDATTTTASTPEKASTP